MASLRSSKGDDETSLLPNTRLEKPIQAVAKVITAPTDRLDLDYGDNHFFFFNRIPSLLFLFHDQLLFDFR